MMAAPQLLLRKPNGTAAGQAINEAQNVPKTKPQPEGEKVVVRRLPPLLTEEEFFKILGDEWKVGHGKVDWFSYWPGKSSQHPSRPSRPSRAYLHVIRKDNLLVLSQAVQNGVWEDAKESYNDPVLILPPTAELSIHKKIPSDKKRLDNRQGTIDQEPEFMAFLESLANPDAHKNTDAAGEPNAEESPAKPEKITTTPLVEYLKEKKAQRAKEAALARSAKQHARQESQGGKTKTATATITLEELKKRAREAKGERTDKVSEKPRDNVKILTKRGTSSAAAEAAKAANTVASQVQDNARSSSKTDSQTKATQSSSQSAAQSTPSGDAASELPKNRRAGIAAAARILQRDLGLSPGNAHRKARQEAAKAEADAKASAAASANASARETASREKKEKEKASTPSSAERSATSANPPDSSAAASPSASGRGRESASGRTRGRRGRGGTTEEGSKAKGTDGDKENRATEVAAPQPPIKPTMILKKRDSTQAAPPSAPSAPSTPVVAPAPATLASQNPTTPKQPSAEGRQRGRGRGGEAKEAAKPSGSTSNTPSTPAPAGPTQAFIKHAHPTQGVTDSALREALEAFGPIKSMDVRKKGIAYVDFADPEALKKAIAASPVTIARASVTILERKSDTEKKEGGKDKEKDTVAPETPATSAPVEKEKTAAPEKEKEKEKEKAPEKEKEREKRDDERRGGRGRGRGRGRGDGGGDKDKEKEKGDKAEKGDSRGGGNAKCDAAAGGAKEAVPQGGSGSDRPVSAPKVERGNAGSASASGRPNSAQDKGEKDNKENEKGEGEKKGENRRGRRRGGRGRGGGGDKDKEKDKEGGGGGRGERKAEGGGGGSGQTAPAA